MSDHDWADGFLAGFGLFVVVALAVWCVLETVRVMGAP